MHEHAPVRTSEEAAKLRIGYTLHQGAKALILHIDDGQKKRFLMCVLPADKKIDNNRLRQILQTKDIRFATIDEVEIVTNGVKIGGVPPFGNLFTVETIVDNELLTNETIVFNAGDRRITIAMKAKDYIFLTKPRLESFCK